MRSVIRRWLICLPIFAAAFWVGGCGRASSQDKPASPAKPASESSAPQPTTIPTIAGTAVIRGRVSLNGPPPDMRIVAQGCHADGEIRDESIVTGEHGGLQNVIVFLKDAPASQPYILPPAVLDQVNCQYEPHVLAMQTGQTLHVRSSDDVMHNVHLICTANRDLNLSFQRKGDNRDVIFASPEEPFLAKCDVHPWMKAWVGVFDHPYFAVTQSDGSFEIRNVPPGKYTIAAWHEILPVQEKAIDVSASAPVTVQFEFRAP